MDISTPTWILNSIFNFLPDILQGSIYAKYFQFWPILLIGFVLALFLTPIIGHIAMKYDITYKPGTKRNNKDFDNEEKALHEGVTPALGGLAITIPTILAILLLFKLDSFTVPILVALLILVIGSSLDDIINLPAKSQLFYQILAATVIGFSIINLNDLSFFNLPLDLYTLNFSILGIQQSLSLPGDIILIIWILICLNAVKWTAGSPGIIEGNSLIIFSLIFIISVRYVSLFSSSLSILISGGLIAFLIFALPPQKIMTGSSGKSVYGLLICVLAIIADTKISTTIMLLALPIVDFVYVISKRIFIYKPKNLIELMRINDTNHLHHQLLKLNLSRKQIILLETAVTLLLGSFVILSTGAIRYFALTIVTSLAIGFIVFINIRASRKRVAEKEKESPESKYSY